MGEVFRIGVWGGAKWIVGIGRRMGKNGSGNVDTCDLLSQIYSMS